MGSFAADTAIRQSAGGVLTCTVEQDWWVVAGPNGGYLAAIVVHALETRVDIAQRPLRSLTVQYQRAPKPGPAQLEVTLEREGRGVTFARVTLRQGERMALSALAVLARPAESELRVAAASPPRVPGPDEIEALADAPAEAPPFGRHFDYRPAVEEHDDDVAVTGGWLRLHEPQELDTALVVALCDSWFPAIFSVVHQPLAVPTLDLTVHVRAELPRPGDWVLGRFTTQTARDGFLEEDAELFSSDGELLAHSRQLALAR